MPDISNTCSIKKCKDKTEISYMGKPLCNKHWNILSTKTPEEIKNILSVKIKNNTKAKID